MPRGLYATWTKRRTSSPATTSDVNVAVRPPGGASFGLEMESAVATSGNATSEPVLSKGRSGVDAMGNLTVGFVRKYDDGGGSEVRLRSLPPAVHSCRVNNVVTPVNQANGPTELAFDMNPAGTGVLAWERGTGVTRRSRPATPRGRTVRGDAATCDGQRIDSGGGDRRAGRHGGGVAKTDLRLPTRASGAPAAPRDRRTSWDGRPGARAAGGDGRGCARRRRGRDRPGDERRRSRDQGDHQRSGRRR